MEETNQGSANLRMTLEEACATILQLANQASTNHHRIGQIYNHVVDNKLAETGGHKSAQVYFGQHVKALSQSLLSTCGTVARAFTEGACARHGVYHLSALITYAKATGLKVSREEPGPTLIDVPAEDGTVERKPFAVCSVKELNLAARHKRGQARPPLPGADMARVQALRDSIAQHFADKTSRTRVNARTFQGKTYVTLQDVPVTDLEKLAEALVDGLVFARAAA